MGPLFKKTTERPALMNSWRHIRENGYTSSSPETKSEIANFEQNASGRIYQMQRRLRNHVFEFDPQKGFLKKKGKSDQKRGIVMASVQNRIVERALLDRLQHDCEFVREVNNDEFSVGGVPERSVPHGLAIVEKSMADGRTFFVRSDISGFFDNIPRGQVLAQLRAHVRENDFMELLSQATRVVLSNEQALGEDRKFFPVDEHGVAQGSPLSPLFGNILLHEFDRRLNDRGVVCVRFVDDFVLMADSLEKVRKAFRTGVEMLGDLGLKCHDPFEGAANPEKSEHGNVRSGFVFLGYQIEPGLYQPSKKARTKLLASLDDHLRAGKRAIINTVESENSFSNRQRYVLTLYLIDRVLRGWGNSFAYCNSTATMEDLDRKLDEKLHIFRKWYQENCREMDWKARRRSGGVCLLSDVEQKKLSELPFILGGSGRRFKQSSRTLTISTDGAVLGSGKRRGKDQGPGGWAFVVHDYEYSSCGTAERTTNNCMELQAVIEALKYAPIDKSLKIQTDSQYVAQGVNTKQPIKSNIALWKEYQQLASGRGIKIVWVKGHSGDRYNEMADALAHQAARRSTAGTKAA